MKTVCKWLEQLSLDAVLVALVWGVALGEGTGWQELLVLALATWLTYVADRLWEVRPGQPGPLTGRHLYYRDNYKNFAFLWLVLLVLAIGLAVLLLPPWKVAGGCLLVMAISVYLYSIGKVTRWSGRLALKRIFVPLVFTVGVVWMTEAWRTWEGLAGSMVLLSGAFANVLLISYWENKDKLLPGWLVPSTAASLLNLLAWSHVALFAHLPTGLGGLVCCGGFFYQYIQIKTARAKQVRAWVDSIMAMAGLVIVLVPWN